MPADQSEPAPPPPAPPVTLSPAEQVLAQLGRQKWVIDARDAAALPSLYTADSAQVVYQGAPGGRTELTRSSGRSEVIASILAGWARTAATWYPGAMIHQLGGQAVEPIDDGRIRCRSYATILGLDQAGAPVLKGYASYDDIWALEAGEWRLAYRETVMYGHAPSRPDQS
jgi:SnoaL-like domain